MNKKFSLCVRIDRITPAHAYLSIFSGMILAEHDHKDATRGKAGDLVLRMEELGPFLDCARPHLVKLDDSVDTIDLFMWSDGWVTYARLEE
jgi:hypothetical protein